MTKEGMQRTGGFFMLKETKDVDITNRFTTLRLGLSFERSNEIEEAMASGVPQISETDLYIYSLTQGTSDTKGALQRDIKELITQVAAGNKDCAQVLFEYSYSYGVQTKLDPEVEKIYLTAAIPVFDRNIRPLLEKTAEGRIFLPEDTTTGIINNKNLSGLSLAQEIYLSGYAAGLVVDNPNMSQKAANEIPNSLPEAEESYLEEARRQLELIWRTTPAEIIGTLIIDPRKITNLIELEEAESKLRYLLPLYCNPRVDRIRDAKKKTKVRIKKDNQTIIADDWAQKYEDPFFEQSRSLLCQEAKQPTSNKGVAKIASRLGYLELARTLIQQDSQKQRPIKELEQLQLLYLVEEASTFNNPPTLDFLVSNFGSFINSQYQAFEQAQAIEQQMKQTLYWQKSGRKQVITPDTYKMTPDQLQQVQTISINYLDYLKSAVYLYNEAVDRKDESSDSQALVTMLEAGLPPEVVPVCRRLMSLGGDLDSLRFDLIPDQKGNFWVAEVQIISGGIPPAALYRQAFESAGISWRSIGEGVMPAFIKRVTQCVKKPFVVGLYSDRPYSSDISKSTSLAGNDSFMQMLIQNGIPATSAFPSEVVKNGMGDFYFMRGSYKSPPITTFYNRVDYVSETAVNTLQDPNMLQIIDALESGQIDMFPRPLPILFGKGIYALLFEQRFESILEAKLGKDKLGQLRACTPLSYWIYPDNTSINFNDLNPKDWVRKGSYAHATLGMVIGEKTPEALLESVKQDLATPYTGTIQRLVDSQTPNFRVGKRVKGVGEVYSRRMVSFPYRLRVEPTIIDGELCDIFVTGNQDRIVHGRETSIMTLASL